MRPTWSEDIEGRSSRAFYAQERDAPNEWAEIFIARSAAAKRVIIDDDGGPRSFLRTLISATKTILTNGTKQKDHEK